LYFDVRVCTEVAKGNSFGSSTISVGVSSKTGATRAVLEHKYDIKTKQARAELCEYYNVEHAKNVGLFCICLVGDFQLIHQVILERGLKV